MNKILILDSTIQIPSQLENKFHEVICIQNSADLLKVTNVDAGTIDSAESFKLETSRFIDRELVNKFNLTDLKKIKVGRELILSLFNFDEYKRYFLSKYHITDDELTDILSTLESFSSVKAKYEREFGNNPKFESLRTELSELNKLIVNFKKATPSEYYAYSMNLKEYFPISANQPDQVKIILNTCDTILTACKVSEEKRERYLDINKVDIKLFKKDFSDVKLVERLTKYVSLYNTLKIVPRLSNLKPNDYLVAGEGAAKVINKFNNLGLRKTTLWFQLLSLKVCKIGTGANIVFIRTLSGAKANIDKLVYFFSENFAEAIIPELPIKGTRVITNSNDAVTTLKSLINIDEGSQFGFDYETNGEEINTSKFENIGYSIANTVCSVYFDLRYIKLNEGEDARKLVLNYTKEFLDKHATAKSKSKVWVFNYSFEMAVSYKEFGVFYEFWDLVVYRNIIGHHMEWWSLKYTAQYDLRIRSWDDDYDGIQGIVFNWLHKWNPSLGKKGGFEPRHDREYFIANLNECKDERIVRTKDSFIWLYDHGYQSHFTVIPAELIGKYGALDSYYTVYAAKINQGKYDDRCERTFMDNIRMGSRLTGVYRSEKLFNDYLVYSKKIFTYAIFHLSRFATYNLVKVRASQSQNFKSIDDVEDYLNSICENEFTKWCLHHYIDVKSAPKLGRSILNYFRNDNYEGNLNSNLLSAELGSELTERIQNAVLSVSDWCSDVKEVEVVDDQDIQDDEDSDNSDEKEETKHIEVIDGEIVKELSKKLGEVLFPYIKYHKEPSYRYSESQLAAMANLSTLEGKKAITEHMNKLFDEALTLVRLQSTLNELNNCPLRKLTYQQWIDQDKYTLRMNSYDPHQFYGKIFEYYQITSPGTFKDTYTKAGIVYEKEYKVLACIDRYDPCGNYNESLAKQLIPFVSWDDMITKVDKVWNDPNFSFVKSANLAEQLQPKKENDYTQAKRYYYVNDPDFTGDDSTIKEDLFNILSNLGERELEKDGNSIIMVCLGAIGKRYAKMVSNYFYGVYSGYAKKCCPADEHLVSTSEGNQLRLYPKFTINMKTTKRWSSGFHTIYGKSNSKRVLTGPPGYGVSYFDISSAEVRSAAYMSGDPDLIAQFEAGLDPYIELAKLKYGQDAPKSVLKAHRKVYKTCLLGQLYGQSAAGMGVRLKISDAESQEVVNQLRATYPHLFKWIEQKQNYCVQHRFIDTFLGDSIEVFEHDPGRLRRTGINYCIQG